MYSMRPTTTLTECGLMCIRVSTTRHLSVHLLGLTTLTNCVFLTQLLTSTSWTQRLTSHRIQQPTTRKENSMSFETHDTSAKPVVRYQPRYDGDMRQHPTGDWTLHADYHALAAR